MLFRVPFAKQITWLKKVAQRPNVVFSSVTKKRLRGTGIPNALGLLGLNLIVDMEISGRQLHSLSEATAWRQTHC